MADDLNFPGYDYLLRIGKSWFTAVEGQAAALNTAWHAMKQGDFDLKYMMKSWAEAVDSYFETVVEASRGPGYVRQTPWLFFDYRAKPTVLRATVTLARAEPDDPVATDFASMEGRPAIASSYATCAFADNVHSQLTIALTPDNKPRGKRAFKDSGGNAAAGMYIGFVLPKGRTSEAPLVIVMLRI